MPGVYAPEAFDLAGTIVGIVEHEWIAAAPRYATRRLVNRTALIRSAYEWLFIDP